MTSTLSAASVIRTVILLTLTGVADRARSIRGLLHNYCLIIVGGIGREADQAAFAQAEIAARVANRAARHFNTGLRAYYFGLAAITWIVHPLGLIGASLLVLAELHRREFRSVVREALRASGR
jgi:uncharacterized membrane protein